MDYVASVGLRCTMHYNPADYLREYIPSHWTIAFMIVISHAVELVSVDSSRKVLIGEDPKQEERPVIK